jgi:hypothetical protein
VHVPLPFVSFTVPGPIELSSQLIEQVCVCPDESVKLAVAEAFVLPPIGIGFDDVVPVTTGGVLPGPQPAQIGSGPPGVQLPAWHVSLRVHALPSLHELPFAFAGVEQTPELRSQVPASWH